MILMADRPALVFEHLGTDQLGAQGDAALRGKGEAAAVDDGQDEGERTIGPSDAYRRRGIKTESPGSTAPSW